MKRTVFFVYIFIICIISFVQKGVCQDPPVIHFLKDEEFIIAPSVAIKEKSIRVKDCLQCEIKNGKRSDCKLTERIRYDTIGRVIKWIIGSDLNRNKIDRVADFLYDNSGNSLIVNATHPGNGQLWKFRYLYSFDQQGRMFPRFDTTNGKSGRVIFEYRGLNSDTPKVLINVIGDKELTDRKLLIRRSIKSSVDSSRSHNSLPYSRTFLAPDSVLVEENYNSKGQLIDRTLSYITSKEKLELKKTSFFYNSDGSLDCELIVDNEHTVSERQCYGYFAGGKLAYFIKDSQSMLVQIEYDESGNRKKAFTYDKFSNATRLDEAEFRNGLLMKESIYLNGELNETKVYKYK